MPAIYPKVSRAKLKQGARKTSSGRGRVALPGVKTDAKQINKGDYADNRELARLISKAMRAAKKSDKAGQQFVLGWRLYPNKNHPRWKDREAHACGCGCGCSA
ncbi:MAG: hypothetical protein WAM77_20385 [Xanthobacteraceae bacterium]|jgi:hypothetical protein